VVIKRNRSKPLVVVDSEHFVEQLATIKRLKGQI